MQVGNILITVVAAGFVTSMFYALYKMAKKPL